MFFIHNYLVDFGLNYTSFLDFVFLFFTFMFK